MDEAAAQKVIEETKAKIDALEKEMEGLQGKDNKKARNEKSKEVSNLKNDKDYIDATRVVAGKEPLQEKNRMNAEEERRKLQEEVSGLQQRLDVVTRPQQPSSQAGALPPVQDEEALRSYVRQQIMAKAESGDLKQAFDRISSNQDANSSVEETRIELRQGLEAAFKNGRLPQHLREATEEFSLQAAKAEVKQGVEKLLDSGKLQELLKKEVPKDEDFAHAKQGIERALESGQLQQQLEKAMPQQKDVRAQVAHLLQTSAESGELKKIVTEGQG